TETTEGSTARQSYTKHPNTTHATIPFLTPATLHWIATLIIPSVGAPTLSLTHIPAKVT
ncbi:Hypothetical predicted protein, partial [Pelobates cultripes]